jgi:uncharacterized MAPEG superfamily protein
MEFIAIVMALALLQFVLFGYQVGAMRGKHGVKAPATSGADEFERMNRVHQNTMEQLVVTIPGLWLFGHYVDPLWGAGIGLVYILSRFVYKASYLKDPAKRGLAFGVGTSATAILVLGGLINAVREVF